MKEYEIVCRFLNACAGEAYPQTHFEEAELSSPEEYIRRKHPHDYDRFRKEQVNDSTVRFTMKSAVSYIYEFTEI